MGLNAGFRGCFKAVVFLNFFKSLVCAIPFNNVNSPARHFFIFLMPFDLCPGAWTTSQLFIVAWHRDMASFRLPNFFKHYVVTANSPYFSVGLFPLHAYHFFWFFWATSWMNTSFGF